MNTFQERNPDFSDIVHVMTSQFVRIVNYDQRTGQVSIIPGDSTSVYTCYDYELVSLKGLDHLRASLNEAAKGIQNKVVSGAVSTF